MPTPSKTVTDRLEKQILLRAPRARVWRAISNADQFGTWFGVTFDGQFTPGAKVCGVLTPTTIDPEVAKKQQSYAGQAFEFTVDRVEPERLFSFRWGPYSKKTRKQDPEPTTLVVFTLEEVPEGTLLTVTESGFDQFPLERRAQAFADNDQGWAEQLRLIAKYLTRGADAA